MGLTAQIGGKNTWPSLGHCLGTWPAETGMTNHRAHLAAYKGQFYWGQVKGLGSLSRHKLQNQSKMIS